MFLFSLHRDGPGRRALIARSGRREKAGTIPMAQTLFKVVLVFLTFGKRTKDTGQAEELRQPVDAYLCLFRP